MRAFAAVGAIAVLVLLGMLSSVAVSRLPSLNRAVSAGQALRSSSQRDALPKRASSISSILDPRLKERIEESYGRLPLRFESNEGQTHPTVKFLARAFTYTLFLTPQEAVLAFDHLLPQVYATEGFLTPQEAVFAFDPWNSPLLKADPSREASFRHRGTSFLRMQLLGANPSPAVMGVDPLPSRSNYFIGSHPSGWRTQVRNFRRVKYTAVYPGIDLVYYGRSNQLEYDFILGPGAKHEDIKLSVDGAKWMEITAQGDLLIQMDRCEIRLRKPFAYQEIDGARHEVAADYERDFNGTVGFRLSNYERNLPLTIDPVLVYSTYLGGQTPLDTGRSIAVDNQGNAYVTGSTKNAVFPTVSSVQPALAGNDDAFVLKFDQSGNTLLFSTFLGGGGSEAGHSIALDTMGNSYVTGFTTSSDFPTASALQGVKSGSDDAFVTKLNATGSAILYSTYLGGPGLDGANGIAVDSQFNAYVVGSTAGGFPIASALQSSFGGLGDAFIAKLNPGGSALVYSTYLGGSGQDFGLGIAVDGAGNAYITGVTASGNFPTASPLQASSGGGDDAFVVKLNAAGSDLVYSTYVGGISNERSNGIAVDNVGSAYIAGETTSMDFPVASPFQTQGTLPDAFIMKLNPAGSALVFSSYLGGNGSDDARSIALDGGGNVYVAGRTSSTNFPTVKALQGMLKGPSDVFLVKLNPPGSSLLHSTYLGGSGSDLANGLAVDAAGSAYLAGVTTSTDFPTANPLQGAPLPGVAGPGGNTIFVAKIAGLEGIPPTPIPTLSQWGVILLAVLIVGVGVWTMRPRRAA